MKKIILTDKEKNAIIYLYTKENKSLRSISEILKINRKVARDFLVSKGIEIEQRRQRKYHFNENYFEDINTSEKAYWLGFIAADGCIVSRNRGGKYLKIRLDVKDKGHLEKFLTAIESNIQVQIKKNTGYSEGKLCADIEVCSNKLVSDLRNKGIVEKKSLILKPPHIKEEFVFDYLRGYFDGDGSLIIDKRNNHPTLCFVGTKEMLNWISEQIHYNGKLEKRYKNDKNTFVFRIQNKNNVMYFLNKIYRKNDICLERKYEKYKLIQSSIEEIQ